MAKGKGSKKQKKKQGKDKKKKEKKLLNLTKNSAVYNILAFTFMGQDSAKETVEDIKSSGALEGYKIAAEAVVEQDPNGKVHFHETGRGGMGAAIGAVGLGLLGLIGGPAGVLALAVSGAVVGGVAGKYLGRPIAKGDLQEIGEAMSPNSSVFLLLLEDKYSEQVVDNLSGYNAKVVTLTVGDELSGQIAAFTAAEINPEQAETAPEPDDAAKQSDN